MDDAWPGLPAYAAGISSGMKLVAVNGRRCSVDELKRAIAASKIEKTPMEFIVDNAGYFKVVKMDYHGGLRYPHLERVAGTSYVLTAIAAPRRRQHAMPLTTGTRLGPYEIVSLLGAGPSPLVETVS